MAVGPLVVGQPARVGAGRCVAVVRRGRLLSPSSVPTWPKTFRVSYNEAIRCHPLGLGSGDNIRGRSTTGPAVVIGTSQPGSDNIRGCCTTSPFVVSISALPLAEEFSGFVERGLPAGERISACSVTGAVVAVPPGPCLAEDFLGFVQRGDSLSSPCPVCKRDNVRPFHDGTSCCHPLCLYLPDNVSHDNRTGLGGRPSD